MSALKNISVFVRAAGGTGKWLIMNNDQSERSPNELNMRAKGNFRQNVVLLNINNATLFLHAATSLHGRVNQKRAGRKIV
jgi:hypothetical protein